MNNTGQGASNYSSYNYFSKQLTEITVKTSIDLVRLKDIQYTSFLRIDKQLNDNGYIVIRDCVPRKSNYKRIRQYEKNKSKIDYLYQHRCQEIHSTNDVIILHSPDAETMELIDTIFWKTYDTPLIKKIELAWDFYVKGIPALEFKEAIQKYLCLRYSRSKSGSCETTYYTNQIRKSSKGMRLYPKKIDGKDVVRLELELHRGKIRDLKIPFPITDKSLNHDYSKMFCFKKIDLDKLMKSEVKKNRHDMAMADIRRPKMGQLVLRAIEAYVDHIDSDSLMESTEKLKDKDHGVKNHARFLVDMKKETNLINDVADRLGFLDEGYRPDMG
jgi:hypothetical protein